MKLGRDEKHTSSIRLGRAIITPAQLCVFVALLFFCAWGSAWARKCTPHSTNGFVLGANDVIKSECAVSFDDETAICAGLVSSACPAEWETSAGVWTGLVTSNKVGCTNGTDGCAWRQYYLVAYACNYEIFCTDKCAADSLVCVTHGDAWDSQNCECRQECPEEPCADGFVWDPDSCKCVSDPCAPDRAACRSVGGKWSGSFDKVLNCCSSMCDVCNNTASRNVFRLKRNECCSQNQAPPNDESRCELPIQSGCGMSTSQFTDPSSGDWNCQDPNGSDAAHSRYYEMCSDDWDGGDGDGGSSESQGSSSSEGSSSSMSSSSQSSSSQGDGSSSSGEGGDGDCPECPLLEDIKDILGSIDGTTGDILLCLQIPHLCPALDQDVDLSGVIKELQDIEDLAGEIRDYSFTSLRNDTVTWTKFDALGNVVDTSIHVMNDTTRKWLNAIADSLGVGTDSLIAHLDSLIKTIPDSVMDSIVKYQKYASDNFDSIIYGTGKGFSLVDSLIDSSVKYFQESNRIWNNYIDTYADSNERLHSDMLRLPDQNALSMNEIMGYGDTASTNLRGDLNGIREAIEGLGDTSGLGGYGDGYGDSLGRYRDSINKYYISDARFGELVDSTEVAWGVDSLDARWDSSYAYGLCNGDDCPPCSDDSCMGSLPANFVQRADSIARIAGDSLEASTKRQRDSLPTFWDSTFKELKQYSWFGSFDSTFLANIGAKIPNSNTCPEHCFAMDVNGTYAYVGYNMHLDWKLCRPIAPNVLNSLNAFDILKLLARILTVVTCLSILMWEVSSRRGGGIGL